MSLAEQSLLLEPYQAPKDGLATLVKGSVAVGQDAKAGETALKLAESYLAWRQFLPALDAYNQAMSLQPGIKEKIDLEEYRKAFNPTASALRKKNDWETLMKVYEQALQAGFLDPRFNAGTANALAKILIEQEIDIEKGIEYAKRSQELNPEQSAEYAYNTLALGLIKQGKFDESILLLQKALEKQDLGALKATLEQARSAKEDSAKDNPNQRESTTSERATR